MVPATTHPLGKRKEPPSEEASPDDHEPHKLPTPPESSPSSSFPPPYGSQAYWELRYQRQFASLLMTTESPSTAAATSGEGSSTAVVQKETSATTPSAASSSPSSSSSWPGETETAPYHAWYFTYDELRPLLMPLLLGANYDSTTLPLTDPLRDDENEGAEGDPEQPVPAVGSEPISTPLALSAKSPPSPEVLGKGDQPATYPTTTTTATEVQNTADRKKDPGLVKEVDDEWVVVEGEGVYEEEEEEEEEADENEEEDHNDQNEGEGDTEEDEQEEEDDDDDGDDEEDAVLERVGVAKQGPISILEVGCGDVPLGVSLAKELQHLEGITGVKVRAVVNQILCVDYSEVVIAMMKKQYGRSKAAGIITIPHKDIGDVPLEFAVVDARKLPYESESFALVMEKGTLDAVLSDKQVGVASSILIVSECARVLSIGGYLVLVSHLNAHTPPGLSWLDEVVHRGLREGGGDAAWEMEVHGAELPTDDGESAFPPGSPGPAVYIIHKKAPTEGKERIPIKFVTY